MHINLRKYIESLNPPIKVDMMIARLSWTSGGSEVEYDPSATLGFPLVVRDDFGEICFDYRGEIVRTMKK